MSDKPPPQSEQLVRIAETRFTVGQSDEGEPFAVDASQPGIARPLRGRGSFRAALADAYRATNGRPPSGSALTDALAVLEGQALDARRSTLALRMAQPDAATLVVDLGEPDTSRCVVITRDGYEVADWPPGGVLFRRTALTGRLPEPADQGDVAGLAELVNVPDVDWPLVVAWLVAAMFPAIPHPVLALLAEQGNGKTSLAKMLTRMVDPSPAEVRAAPRSLEEWSVAAAGSWTVALDNLSNVSPWLQDALCRAATGDGIVKRALYTDSDLAVLRFRRVVVLTGIDLGALRGDLADRTLLVQPERIDPTRRRLESDLEDEFVRAWPGILAGLYALTAQVLDVVDDVHLVQPPRMADYARIVAAVDQLTGSTGLARYAEHAENLAADVLEADDVATAVVAFMADRTVWTGTATDLLEQLTTDDRARHKSWPSMPQHLSGRLRRAAPVLRHHAGIDLEDDRDGEHRELSLRRHHDARDANDAHFGTSSLQKERREKGGGDDKAPKPASSASQRHNGDHRGDVAHPAGPRDDEQVIHLTFDELVTVLLADDEEPTP